MLAQSRSRSRHVLGHSVEWIDRQELGRIRKSFDVGLALLPENIVAQPPIRIEARARNGEDLCQKTAFDSEGIRQVLRGQRVAGGHVFIPIPFDNRI